LFFGGFDKNYSEITTVQTLVTLCKPKILAFFGSRSRFLRFDPVKPYFKSHKRILFFWLIQTKLKHSIVILTQFVILVNMENAQIQLLYHPFCAF